jgi:His-Xaa-Ser system protein HxsD
MGTEGVPGSPPIAREVLVSSTVYSLDTVKKAAYRFIDRASADISVNEGDIVCKFSFVRGTSESAADAAVQDFRAELLDQDLRQKVALETAPIRNAILALAFSASKPPERE